MAWSRFASVLLLLAYTSVTLLTWSPSCQLGRRWVFALGSGVHGAVLAYGSLLVILNGNAVVPDCTGAIYRSSSWMGDGCFFFTFLLHILVHLRVGVCYLV